jgi:hypothetical protein
MSKIGFANEESAPCQHIGNWGQDTFNGVLFHKCFTCGKTWALALTEEGTLFWERVREEGEVEGVNKLGLLQEEVQPVPGGEGKGDGVQQKSKPRGRKRSSVQDLPPPLQLQPDTEDVEA